MRISLNVSDSSRGVPMRRQDYKSHQVNRIGRRGATDKREDGMLFVLSALHGASMQKFLTEPCLQSYDTVSLIEKEGCALQASSQASLWSVVIQFWQILSLNSAPHTSYAKANLSKKNARTNRVLIPFKNSVEGGGSV